jgi:hypothetical protein
LMDSAKQGPAMANASSKLPAAKPTFRKIIRAPSD